MKNIIGDYKGKIEELEAKLPKEDKDILETYIRERRVTASAYKVQQYKTRLLVMRDIVETSFNKFNDKTLIDNLLIIIKDSDREKCGKNELKKVLKHFLIWKFNDLNLVKSIKMENPFNQKRFNAATLPTPEEIEALIRKANNIKFTAMITLQVELGLRPHELIALKWRNIKFHGDHALIEIYANKTTQTRELPIKNCLIHLLKWRDQFEYPNRTQDDYVFPSPKDRNEKLYPSYMSQLYRRLSKKAGIRTINPYMVRHGTLSSFYKKHQDSRLNAKFGGHSIKTSEVYVNLNDKDIKDILMEKLFPVKEPTIEERDQMQKLKNDVDMLMKVIMMGDTEYMDRLREVGRQQIIEHQQNKEIEVK